MKCRAFEHSYSHWMDTRKASPLEEDLRLHLTSCARCAAFVHSMGRLEEMFQRKGVETVSGIPEPASGICEIVIQESRNRNPLATGSGFALRLAGRSLPAVLTLVPGIAPGWASPVQTILVLLGLVALALDVCFNHECRPKRIAGTRGPGRDDAGRHEHRRTPMMPPLTLTMLRASGAL